MPPLLLPPIDPDSTLPRYRQVYDRLRRAILSSQLAPGQRLPASRPLADTLGVSRQTVICAFEMLLDEGYLVTRRGAGTFVSEALPDTLTQPPEAAAMWTEKDPQPEPTPLFLPQLAGVRHEVRAFRPGIPDLHKFPFDTWARLAGRLTRSLPTKAFGYGDPRGYRPLREALARYLRTARAVRCSADQIIMVGGSQQGLALAARVLLAPGETAWVEDPGYQGAATALRRAGMQLAPIPLDDEGISVEAGQRMAPSARMAAITPSHQFPLGITMSLPRRLQLLQWAREQSAWILEDDYDSEFRYEGRPLASLQGLDEHDRVIYVGTFSKVLFPGLRLGYLVVPPAWVSAFAEAKADEDRQTSFIPQATLHAFIEEGYFSQHLRRMRLHYHARQQRFLALADAHLGPRLRLTPAPAGIHMMGWLPPGFEDRAFAEAAEAVGVTCPPLSIYRHQAPAAPGLVLGYAAYSDAAMRDAFTALQPIFDQHAEGAS